MATGEWLLNIFRRLEAIFAKEIAAYNGTVERYLKEKSQSLHVAERIFFIW